MPLSKHLPAFLLLSTILSLGACGGSGSGNTDPAPTGENEKPVAVIDDVAPINEGTSATSLNGENSTDSDGSVAEYQWAVENNAGFAEVTINSADESFASLILPLSVPADTVITVSLIVTDNEGLASEKVTKDITIINDGGVVVINPASFDGVWYGPCINNPFGFTSARQKITISGDSLISDITSYTAGVALALDCALPARGIIVDSDITAVLGYGSSTSNSDCVNNRGIDTTITLTRFQSSGNDHSSQPELNDGVQLVTGSRNDFLPDSSVVCLKANGNLLFAGHEYTGTPNTNIDVPVVVPPNTEVTWEVGNHSYNGGTASGSSSSGASRIGSTGADNFGVLTVNTSGFDTSNGDYSGSSINITHTLQGAGSYSIGDTSVLLEDNLSHRRMTISVAVGTLNTAGNAIGYHAISGTAIVTVDSNGKYHFTITSPITLSNKIDVGSGIPGSPASFSFTMNNIYDHNP